MGDEYANQSPFGQTLQTVRLLSDHELVKLFSSPSTYQPADLKSSVSALRTLMFDNRQSLILELRTSTGFGLADSTEVIDSCLQFLDGFESFCPSSEEGPTSRGRSITLVSVPWGTVAAILPQNAFLSMALLCLLHGSATGNRVILRAPSGSARLAAILGQLLIQSGWDPNSFSLVVCNGGKFVEAWHASQQISLLHYMGSSERAASLLASSFEAGKPCLIDGEGNSMVYVDQDQDPNLAASLLWQGALRYNGQTCTSINGVVVHPEIDGRVREMLRKMAQDTPFGHGEHQVGPLFRRGQAELAEARIQSSGGRLGRIGRPNDNLFPPTLVEDPDVSSDLVTQGLFAPALWLRTGDYEDFKSVWRSNRFPLCAAVLSHRLAVEQMLVDLGRASRLVMNGDPSLEDPFEPWGAYPPSGSNPVGLWGAKYLRTLQLDQPT